MSNLILAIFFIVLIICTIVLIVKENKNKLQTPDK